MSDVDQPNGLAHQLRGDRRGGRNRQGTDDTDCPAVDGLELKHSYPIASGYEGCLTQWNEALGAVHAALEARGPLLLNNPPAVYNGAHIASVEFSFVGAAKIVERINNAHRGMGFRYEATPAPELVS